MLIPDPHADRHARYAEMRARAPVHFNSETQVWEVYGYNDIQTVMGDPATFSSDIQRGAMKTTLQTMITMDPPRHTLFRKLIARAFTTKTVADLEPSILRITNELMDRVAQSKQMDIISELAYPLPITVISELLGLPLADRPQFRRWSELAVQGAELAIQGLEREPHMLEAVAQLTEYLEALASERRKNPQDDLISGLASAELDGESLTTLEISSTCRLLLIGGFETTTNLIGNSLFLLLQRPDLMAQLRSEPKRLANYIEEVLRYHTSFQIFQRVATRDVELGGHVMREGQKVVIFLGSGNRDETVFSDADKFDMNRSPNRHLTFGYGIHLCLGAVLARTEAQIAINTFMARLPSARLDKDGIFEPLASQAMLGLQHIPVLL